MGFFDAFRRQPAPTGVFGETITESRNELGDVKRIGYETDIPLGGMADGTRARTHGSSRRQLMEELHQAYMTCPWVSTCADTVARLVTAGGIELVPEEGDLDQVRPPIIQQLDQLMAAANEREDGVQLLRSTVTDLMVFGDGFIETGWIGDVLAALWTLDTTTMNVGADEHGNLAGYYQTLDSGRQADFTIDEVIHVSLDSPRGGIYGVSPTQKLHVTIVTWLFAAACLKEFYRRGMPLRLAVDLGADTTPTDSEKYRQNFQHKHLGPRNIGQPYLTRTGTPGTAFAPPVKELGLDQIQQLHETLNRCRDEIIAGFGLSPAMVGVIESGNLGGGTGEAQAKATHYGTVLPIQNILLEKLTFHLLTSRGVTGWKFAFAEVDYRDSKTVEEIRDMRLRNGSYTLNTYRAEIGEDPVDGGDDAVLVDRQNLVLWSDLADFSKALIASKEPSATPQVPEPTGAGAPDQVADVPAGDTDVPAKESVLERVFAKAFETQHTTALLAETVTAAVAGVSKAVAETAEPVTPVVTVNLPEQPAPVVNIEPAAVTVNVPEQAPPVVTVNPDIHLPEQPAPVVNFTNEVHPSEVQVFQQSSPSKVVFKRDPNGNITSATAED